MRALLQRAGKSAVSIKKDGQYKFKDEIEKGFVILLGVCDEDTDEDMNKLVDKIVKLRVFEDENGKMNVDIKAVGGEILLVSQFTLYADCTHGNRPGFTKAGKPDYANEMYKKFGEKLRENDIIVKTGVFGADMKVDIQNLGPVTIMLDSKELLKK
jgi:D-tyrosyl-tRNA(Tyr) deacylase